MTDKEPTREQIKELWEWCGFEYKHEEIVDASASKVFITSSWFNGIETCLPELDLNNLFKYAVPKLRELKYYIILRDISKGFHCSLVYTTAEKKSWYGEANDPALALFWAIYSIPHFYDQIASNIIAVFEEAGWIDPAKINGYVLPEIKERNNETDRGY